MKRQSVLLFMLCMGMLMLSACNASHHSNYAHVEAMPAGDRTAAILPLVNLTAHPNAGRITSDILSTEMYGLKGFTFLESTALLETLKAGEEDLDYVLDKTVAQRIGRKLGVEMVVYGSVSEYRYKRGLDQSPAIGLNLRMLDVNTGTVVWASSFSRTGGCFFVCDDSLNRITQEACKEAVTALSEAMPSAP